MTTKYQLILLGKQHSLEKCLVDLFFIRLEELGVDSKHIEIIRNFDFEDIYIANAPTYCLYFGEHQDLNLHIKTLEQIKKDANMILPIVDNKQNFRQQVPELLHGINGFQLDGEGKLEQLISTILEGFSLLRQSRRVFISYRRNEATGVAIQLYETLGRHGFDVFLDTHSIHYGEDFQAELWHRMVDTDVVIALNTPGFLETTWTAQEFAKANALSIGVLQLVWPENSSEKAADLTTSIFLEKNHFLKNNYSKSRGVFKKSTLIKIVEKVESLRARNLGARQDNIITEFIDSANRQGIKADLQVEKIIQVKDRNGCEFIIIPTVGVPQSFNYSQSHNLIERIESSTIKKAFILFDHRNIREKWIDHLDWLDSHLPVKTLKITNLEKWMIQH